MDNPSAISGLRGWWKADAITSPPANGGTLQTWTDSSGNGFNATQAAPANRPTYRTTGAFLPNGKPAIEFSSSSNTWMSAAVAPNGPTTRFVVFRPKTAGVRHTLTGAEFGYEMYIDTSNTYQMDVPNDSSLNVTPTPTAFAANTWYVLSFDANGSNLTHTYVNGVAEGTSTVAFSESATALEIGARGWDTADYPADGYVAEIIDYNRVLNTTERMQVDSYLTAKYAFGVPASGLRGWWKADAITSPPADGATLQTWTDSSGNGVNATQATSGNRPIYRTSGAFLPNNKPVVEFVSASSTWMRASVVNNGATTRFVVARLKTLGARQTFYGYDSGYESYSDANNYMHVDVPNIATLNFPDSPENILAADAWYVFALDSNGSSVHHSYVNAMQVATSPISATATATTLDIGARGYNGAQHPLNGYIAEIVDYNRVLTAAELTGVNHYLMAKYGIITTPLVAYDFNAIGSAGSSLAVSDTIPDVSGNSYDLTVEGSAMSIANGYDKQGIVSNGSTYAEVPSPTAVKPTTAVTWMCWAKATVPVWAVWGQIFGRNNDDPTWGETFSFYTDITNGTLRFLTRLQTDSQSEQSGNVGTVLANNTWVHIAATWSAADPNLRVYINGSQASTAAVSGTSLYYGSGGNTSSYFSLFRNTTFNERVNNVQIDDVRVFGVQLSAMEIAVWMNKPREGRLGKVKYWDGSQWAAHSLKYWDGTQWSTHKLKGYDGSGWIEGK